MTNRILDVVFENRRLDPLQAEVLVHVRPQRLTPTTEVRGRLMGPSCPYSTTLEIAHPLTEHTRNEIEGTIVSRVVIPEASLWDPISPFLYAGPVELWQDAASSHRVQVRHGLRKFFLSPQGLRVNGKPFVLKARAVTGLTADEATTLRATGVNTLVAPLQPESLGVWDVADRFGFLVVGRVGEDFEPRFAPTALVLTGHPSCLGFLIDEDRLSVREAFPELFRSAFVGLLVRGPSERALPGNVDFVVAAGDDGGQPAGCGRPVLFALP